MKKLFSLVAFLVLVNYHSQSQTDLTIAKDFKAVDVNGVVHSLFHYLDNDKIVLLMFTTIGCGSCYTAYPYVENSFAEFGCNFGNVVTMLVSNNHSYTDFHEEPFSEFGSIKIANPPGESIKSDYSVFAYPTFVLILPDHTIVEQDIWPISGQILIDKILEHGGVLMDCPDVETFDVVTTIFPEGSGTVRGSGSHIPGNQIELHAIPANGWAFENWTNQDSQVVSTSPYHNLLVPEENVYLTANFKMVTSIDQTNVTETPVRIFPNPAIENIFVNFSNGFGNQNNVAFQIFDSTGRMVKGGKILQNNFQINISGLERGVYFIKIGSVGQMLKLVKE